MPAGFMRSRSSRVTHRTRRRHTVAIDHCSSVTVALSQRLTAHMEAQTRNGKEAAHFGVHWEKTYGYAADCARGKHHLRGRPTEPRHRADVSAPASIKTSAAY